MVTNSLYVMLQNVHGARLCSQQNFFDFPPPQVVLYIPGRTCTVICRFVCGWYNINSKADRNWELKAKDKKVDKIL